MRLVRFHRFDFDLYRDALANAGDGLSCFAERKTKIATFERIGGDLPVSPLQ